ncbi:MAG: hypothetical protein AAF996_04455 [Pseudomonadota bacterium]
MVRASLSILLAAVGLGGCQHASEDATPAVLADTSETNLDALKTAMANTMGRAQIELGVSDLSNSSRLAVLPPRLSPNDDRSPALPTYFDLVIKNGMCMAVHSETGSETELRDVACKPRD